jgi:hypothetical protein
MISPAHRQSFRRGQPGFRRSQFFYYWVILHAQDTL